MAVAEDIGLASILEAYLGAWNAADASERTALLERSVTDDVVFIDPMAGIQGRDALAAHIARMREAFPDVGFESGGEPDHHNQFVRAPWVAVRGEEVVLRGLDIDEVAPDGRLSRIVGFFDEPEGGSQ